MYYFYHAALLLTWVWRSSARHFSSMSTRYSTAETDLTVNAGKKWEREILYKQFVMKTYLYVHDILRAGCNP